MHRRGAPEIARAAPNVDPARVEPRLADVQRPARHGRPGATASAQPATAPPGIRCAPPPTLRDPTPRARVARLSGTSGVLPSSPIAETAAARRGAVLIGGRQDRRARGM